MLNLKRVLTGKDLIKEKRKDYRNVVITQIIIVVTGLILSSFLTGDEEDLTSQSIITIFFLFGTIYSFMLWDLLRDFTNNLTLIRSFLWILILIVVIGLLFEFPLYRIIEVKNRAVILFLVHGLLFPIEVTIIGFAIKDIFSGQYMTGEKLWGAACVYLMIGISFGSLYDFINIMLPGSFGVPVSLGFKSYSESIYYSFSILGGLDTVYNNPIKLIRNLGVIEAVWGNLYVVLIIGKLLTLPKKP